MCTHNAPYPVCLAFGSTRASKSAFRGSKHFVQEPARARCSRKRRKSGTECWTCCSNLIMFRVQSLQFPKTRSKVCVTVVRGRFLVSAVMPKEFLARLPKQACISLSSPSLSCNLYTNTKNSNVFIFAAARLIIFFNLLRCYKHFNPGNFPTTNTDSLSTTMQHDF